MIFEENKGLQEGQEHEDVHASFESPENDVSDAPWRCPQLLFLLFIVRINIGIIGSEDIYSYLEQWKQQAYPEYRHFLILQSPIERVQLS